MTPINFAGDLRFVGAHKANIRNEQNTQVRERTNLLRQFVSGLHISHRDCTDCIDEWWIDH